jgi:deoxyribodipyrimidine photo-lyase
MAAARKALDDFLPRAGRDYAARRNYDNGPGQPATVSKLSPWVRNRILPEWEILSAVMEEHSESAAAKFIDEVCWRTYWKGYLQLRPDLWRRYNDALAVLLPQHRGDVGYQRAVEGRTGIDCFDLWNTELIETNYLHNHARMWFASIWVHTLKLPWQLGADWFLRHLLDGDPASNTLSWRWVAGLHTRGKTYLARPDNIRKYTDGRFRVEAALAEDALPLEEPPVPAPGELSPEITIPKGQRLGLLVTDDDVCAAHWLEAPEPFFTRAGFFPRTAYARLNIAESVLRFRRESMQNLELDAEVQDGSAVLNWAQDHQLDGIVMAEPSVGPTADSLRGLHDLLHTQNVALYTRRHWWDQTLYPQATHGFFRFKKAIPKALSQLNIRER